MNKIGLFCEIRKARKIKKQKNTNVKINDIVQRDYDNKNHEFEILAIDVTYIPTTYELYKITYIFQ
ncbi:hypothetical protein IKS57_05555 [bacterium]|nr:hypothetical protein [bacterium]